MLEEIVAAMTTKGLNSNQISFLFKMSQDILPTRKRLFRLKISESLECELCNGNVVDDLEHSLLGCDFNGAVNDWLLAVLLIDIDSGLLNVDLTSSDIVSLKLPLEPETRLPVLWFLTSVLSLVWKTRLSRKRIYLAQIKAIIEGDIIIMKKTDHFKTLSHIIETALKFITC